MRPAPPLTVGELLEALAGYPVDTVVKIEDGEVGDINAREVARDPDGAVVIR